MAYIHYQLKQNEYQKQIKSKALYYLEINWHLRILICMYVLFPKKKSNQI